MGLSLPPVPDDIGIAVQLREPAGVNFNRHAKVINRPAFVLLETVFRLCFYEENQVLLQYQYTPV